MSRTGWTLGTMSRSADGHVTFKDIRDFSDEEYDEFSKFHQALRQFSVDERIYLMVLQNYLDFRTLLDLVLQQWQVEKRMDDLILENIYMEVNRLLINLLASFTSYLNLTERKLKESPDFEEKFESFQEACSRAYDNDFAYRFLYRLRNFSQHYELPIGNINASQSINDDGTPAYAMRIGFLRDGLINNDFRSWGDQVRTELEVMDDEFDVVPLVENLMERLEEIENVLSGFRVEDVEPAAKYFEDLLQEVERDGEMPCLLLLDEAGEEGKMKVAHFPLHIIAAVRMGIDD